MQNLKGLSLLKLPLELDLIRNERQPAHKKSLEWVLRAVGVFCGLEKTLALLDELNLASEKKVRKKPLSATKEQMKMDWLSDLFAPRLALLFDTLVSLVARLRHAVLDK